MKIKRLTKPYKFIAKGNKQFQDKVIEIISRFFKCLRDKYIL